MEQIYKTDRAFEIAVKIFEQMDVHQSCSVGGFESASEDDIRAKGEVVIEELIQLDISKNCRNGKRRRVRPENQIGDYVAQKAFKYQKRIVDGLVRYDFWRIQ